MSNRKFVEIHMLQSVSTNAINCGESGEIKMLGNRQRISSQAWKRPTRIMLNDTLNNKTIHTRSLADELNALTAEGVSQYNIDETIKVLNKLFTDKSEVGNGVMAKYSSTDVEFFKNIARLGHFTKYTGKNDKQLVEDLKANETSLGIALFGRMFANEPDLSVHAAAKYAHSYSTHEVKIDDDYFVAVDDLNSNGAGHIDSKSYTYSTQYRYIGIDFTQLEKNLGRTVSEVEARNMIRAIVLAFPTGRENAMYCRTRPEYVRITVRDNNAPCTADTAFENRIRDAGCGYMKPSIEALQNFFANNNIEWDDEYLSKVEYVLGSGTKVEDVINSTISALR